MSHRNHLSRPDLYTYGFKESSTWGDDRRALEAALWEIDQLERQTEYEYRRPYQSHPWAFGRSSVWRPSHSSGGPSNARYHGTQVTRSTSDLYPISESGMSSLSSQLESHARYDDSTSFDRYQRDYAHRTAYPSSHAVPSGFCGYPGSQSSMASRGYQPPYDASPLRPSNSNYQHFRDSIGASHLSNYQHHSFAPSMAHSRSSSYGSGHYSQRSSPTQQISTPGQLQMVARRSSRNESPNPEPTSWSMVATEGTSRSESPQASQNFGDNWTSGYVESHGDFYSSNDEGYISDSDDDYSSNDEGYISDSDDDYTSDSDPEEYFH